MDDTKQPEADQAKKSKKRRSTSSRSKEKRKKESVDWDKENLVTNEKKKKKKHHKRKKNDVNDGMGHGTVNGISEEHKTRRKKSKSSEHKKTKETKEEREQRRARRRERKLKRELEKQRVSEITKEKEETHTMTPSLAPMEDLNLINGSEKETGAEVSGCACSEIVPSMIDEPKEISPLTDVRENGEISEAIGIPSDLEIKDNAKERLVETTPQEISDHASASPPVQSSLSEKSQRSSRSKMRLSLSTKEVIESALAKVSPRLFRRGKSHIDKKSDLSDTEKKQESPPIERKEEPPERIITADSVSEIENLSSTLESPEQSSQEATTVQMSRTASPLPQLPNQNKAVRAAAAAIAQSQRLERARNTPGNGEKLSESELASNDSENNSIHSSERSGIHGEQKTTTFHPECSLSISPEKSGIQTPEKSIASQTSEKSVDPSSHKSYDLSDSIIVIANSETSKNPSIISGDSGGADPIVETNMVHANGITRFEADTQPADGISKKSIHLGRKCSNSAITGMKNENSSLFKTRSSPAPWNEKERLSIKDTAEAIMLDEDFSHFLRQNSPKKQIVQEPTNDNQRTSSDSNPSDNISTTAEVDPIIYKSPISPSNNVYLDHSQAKERDLASSFPAEKPAEKPPAVSRQTAQARIAKRRANKAAMLKNDSSLSSESSLNRSSPSLMSPPSLLSQESAPIPHIGSMEPEEQESFDNLLEECKKSQSLEQIPRVNSSTQQQNASKTPIELPKLKLPGPPIKIASEPDISTANERTSAEHLASPRLLSKRNRFQQLIGKATQHRSLQDLKIPTFGDKSSESKSPIRPSENTSKFSKHAAAGLEPSPGSPGTKAKAGKPVVPALRLHSETSDSEKSVDTDYSSGDDFDLKRRISEGTSGKSKDAAASFSPLSARAKRRVWGNEVSRKIKTKLRMSQADNQPVNGFILLRVLVDKSVVKLWAKPFMTAADIMEKVALTQSKRNIEAYHHILMNGYLVDENGEMIDLTELVESLQNKLLQIKYFTANRANSRPSTAEGATLLGVSTDELVRVSSESSDDGHSSSRSLTNYTFSDFATARVQEGFPYRAEILMTVVNNLEYQLRVAKEKLEVYERKNINHIFVDSSQVKIGKLIAQGAIGTKIRECLVDGFNCIMKELDMEYSNVADLGQLKQEIMILSSLAPHDNIVRYLYHSFENGKLRMFMTRYHISLGDYLEVHKPKSVASNSSEESKRSVTNSSPLRISIHTRNLDSRSRSMSPARNERNLPRMGGRSRSLSPSEKGFANSLGDLPYASYIEELENRYSQEATSNEPGDAKQSSELNKSAKKKKRNYLEFQKLLKIIRDVAEGLSYLHANGVIHRDIKADNMFCMLDENNQIEKVCIGDFDSAYKMNMSSKNEMKDVVRNGLTEVVGSPSFCAPEVITAKKTGVSYSEKIDVYSFGIMIFEITSLQEPYAECPSLADIAEKVEQGILPEMSEELPISYQPILQLARQCTQYKPEDRPTSAQLCKLLDGIIV